MNRFIAVAALLLTFLTCAQPSPAGSRSDAVFRKLRSLAGYWEGGDEQGRPVKTNFKVMVSGTVVMETLAPSNMEDMVTLYSVDGDGIALVHYCPTNNQPHMRATPPSGNIRELVFTFQNAGNLPDLAVGHEHKLVILFEDEDHITERWTWRKNGKDTEMIFHFARAKGS